MHAIVVRRGSHEPELIETARPDPNDGEVLLRMLRVGIDGTDHEVLESEPAAYPPGDDYMILGHEAVGVVEEPNGTRFDHGDVVVPTVRRRPDDSPNEYFDRGEPDMAPTGHHVECGISGAHGFMAEFVAVPERRLVEIPRHLAEFGCFVEPISISEKAIEHAYASRSAFDWTPEQALVLGNGALGLVTLAMVRQDFEDIYCLGKRDRPDPTIDVIESLGGAYIDSRETPVDEIPVEYGGMDLIYEATGYAKHPFESVNGLAPNGVAALVGISEPWTFEVDGGSLHTELVVHNKALVGTVNSNERHFKRAIRTLRALPEWLFEDLITTVTGPEDVDPAFVDDDAQIKAVVEFDSLDGDTSDS